MSIFGIVFLVVLFLPWKKNVQGNGFVTTLEPNQRPQSIESAISGRVEEWYVSEGQIVNKGAVAYTHLRTHETGRNLV